MFAESAIGGGAVLWRSRGGAGGVLQADGSADLILRDDTLLFVGPSTRRIHTAPDRGSGTVGVRFAPGSAARLLTASGVTGELAGAAGGLAAHADELSAARELLGAQAAGEWERTLRALAAGAERGVEQGVEHGVEHGAVMTQFFARAGAATPGWVPVVRRAARAALAVPTVLELLSWSERTLRRQMLREFGYGYPTLVRILRAHIAVDRIRAGEALGDVAASAGYADQSHLTRELVRFAGEVPGKLRVS